MSGDFWDRLAERVRPTETLKTIEDPRTIVRAFNVGTAVSVTQVLISAALLAFFDEPVVAWGAVGLAVVLFASWVAFAMTGSVLTAIVMAFAGGTAGNVFAHVLLGGFAYSGGIFLFGITFVVASTLLAGRRVGLIFGLVTGATAVAFGFMEQALQASRESPNPAMTTIFFVVVLVGSINLLPPLVAYFMGRLRHERERAEKLLLNVLPARVAAELKERGRTTARHYDQISVLFADIVGFTPLAATMEPEEVVDRLNGVFSHFDELAEKHGVEKIRTIGDSYMVAAGVPTPRVDHAHALAALALEMMAYADEGPLSFRVGINSGPVVAGVIGTTKFQYDIWGDTVNTAARMESHGETGRIQISDLTRELIKHEFQTTPRGDVEIKGKGTLMTWWLDPMPTTV